MKILSCYHAKIQIRTSLQRCDSVISDVVQCLFSSMSKPANSFWSHNSHQTSGHVTILLQQSCFKIGIYSSFVVYKVRVSELILLGILGYQHFALYSTKLFFYV